VGLALRIDNTHRPWALVFVALSVAAIALHAWLSSGSPDGKTGGTQVGLFFGIAGSLVMLFVGSLSAHRWLSSIRWLPRSWIGRRQDWLRGHIWLGLLSVVLILLHSNYRWGGPLTAALWIVLGITTVSGIVGVVLQHFLPREITARIEREAIIEQVPYLCQRMREDSDEAVEKALERADELEKAARELDALYKQVTAFLVVKYDAASPLANKDKAEKLFKEVSSLPGLEPARAAIARLEELCTSRRQVGELAPAAQVPFFCQRMREEADHAFEEFNEAPVLSGRAQKKLEALHRVVISFLGERYETQSQIADLAKAVKVFEQVRGVAGMELAAEAVSRLEALCNDRRRLELAPAEHVPYFCRWLLGQADVAFAKAPKPPVLSERGRQELVALHAVVRSFLSESYQRGSQLADPIRAELMFEWVRTVPGIDQVTTVAEAVARMEVLARERRDLGEQEILHAYLHNWLLVHVPITVALLVLGVAHAVLAVYW
jgi:hypothetical protein